MNNDIVKEGSDFNVVPDMKDIEKWASDEIANFKEEYKEQFEQNFRDFMYKGSCEFWIPSNNLKTENGE